jgi:hypothetical protein
MRYVVETQTALRELRTCDFEFYGGVFTGFRNKSHYLVKSSEPIPLELLKRGCTFLGPRRPKNHLITGQPINYGQVPFGYKAVNGTLQEDPLEQFVLRQMKQMREDGATLSSIASFLKDSGIPTKNGGRWQSNTVNQILGGINILRGY